MIYRARWVVPVVSEPIENGDVLVQGDRITAVGVGLSTSWPAEPVTDLGNAAILPGFINAHSHLDYTIVRGRVGDLPFPQWVFSLGKYGNAMTDDDSYWSSMLGLAEGIAAGYTTYADACYSGQPARATTDAGVKGICYREVFAFRAHHNPDEQLKLLVDRLDEMRSFAGPDVTIGVSPHSPYMARPELLKSVKKLAEDENLPVSLHVSESEDELNFLRDFSGPYAELARAGGWEPEGRWLSPVRYLEHLGLLRPGTQCVHCIYLDGEDIDIIAKSGASIAHCPKSNAKLGRGVAPVVDMLKSGVPVGLGTDSVVSNNVLSPFEEMLFAVDLQRAVGKDPVALTAKQALELATTEAARSLRLQDEVGSIKAGARADLTVVALSSLRFEPASDVVNGVVFSAAASDVILTVSAGKELYRFGEFLSLDIKEVVSWARKSLVRVEQALATG